MEDFLVFLDGEYFPASTVIRLAMGATDYHIAEHYLVSLLSSAYMYEDRRLFNKCQEIRKRFGVYPYPDLPASEGNLPPVRSQEEEVRRRYGKLLDQQKFDILKKAILLLLSSTDENGQKIFSQKQHWMGVFLVLRDRLGVRCSQSGFADYATKITPSCCPDELRIGNSTMTNFAKTITEDKVYYEMKHNPFAEVCDTLWGIIIKLFLTKS